MNILIIYDLILIFTLVIFLVLSSINDIKHGKVFNKDIVLFIIIGTTINAVFFCLFLYLKVIVINAIIMYIINILISLVTSYLLYFYKIWAAGDAKFFFGIMFFLPYNLLETDYLNIFPGFYLLVSIFIVGFVFLIIESIFKVLIEIRLIQNNKLGIFEQFKNINLIDVSLKYFFCYLFSANLISFITLINMDFFNSNKGFILTMNILLINWGINLLNNYKKLISIIIALLVLYLFTYIFLIPATKFILFLSLSSILIYFVILLLRYFGQRYNYKVISSQDIQTGMIISYESIIEFNHSNTKGLPKYTNETTDTRITAINVEGIKKWGAAKALPKMVRVVRHLPFAPIISFGALCLILFRLYLFCFKG